MDTAQFLEALYANIPNGWAEVRLLRGDAPARRMWREMPLNQIRSGGLMRLFDENENGWNVFHRMGISANKGARKDDITYLPALWVDIDRDEHPFLLFSEYMPSIIIRSGGGWHGYWLLDEPLRVTTQNRAQIERTLDGIAMFHEGDRNCRDITRMLRLPGTINYKYPAECYIWMWMNDTRYNYTVLRQQFAPLGAAPQAHIKRHVPQDAIVQHPELPQYVLAYLQTGAVRGERNATLNRCAFAYNRAGISQGQAEAELGQRAAADGLPEREIMQTIASAYRANPTPQLPRHMQNLIAAEDGLEDES